MFYLEKMIESDELFKAKAQNMVTGSRGLSNKD
jgi:hypothetical protein